jgi:hypothetical protein
MNHGPSHKASIGRHIAQAIEAPHSPGHRSNYRAAWRQQSLGHRSNKESIVHMEAQSAHMINHSHQRKPAKHRAEKHSGTIVPAHSKGTEQWRRKASHKSSRTQGLGAFVTRRSLGNSRPSSAPAPYCQSPYVPVSGGGVSQPHSRRKTGLRLK